MTTEITIQPFVPAGKPPYTYSHMQLTFYGGTGEATGSNYILESGGTKIMIDCGLHQGSHYADRENFDPFAYDPKRVTAVFITHSHLDHIGRLPSLVLAGFQGRDLFHARHARFCHAHAGGFGASTRERSGARGASAAL